MSPIPAIAAAVYAVAMAVSLFWLGGPVATEPSPLVAWEALSISSHAPLLQFGRSDFNNGLGVANAFTGPLVEWEAVTISGQITHVGEPVTGVSPASPALPPGHVAAQPIGDVTPLLPLPD